MTEHRSIFFTFTVAFRLPSESCKKMTKQTVVAFNCIRFCFRLYVYIAWDKMLVRFPKICHHLLDFFFLEDIPQLFTGCCVTVAQYAVDESFSMSINSNPYPAAVFFEEI